MIERATAVLVCLIAATACTRLESVPPPAELAQADLTVQRQYAELRAAFDQAEGDERGPAMCELAMWYHAYRLDEESRIAYRNCRRLMPNDPRYRYYEGILAETQLRLDDAAAAFEDTIALSGYPAAVVRLAEIELRRGKAQRALALIAPVAASTGPRGAVAHSRALFAMSKVDEAIHVLDQALAASPDSSRLQYELGLRLRDAGRTAAAQVYLERARPSAEPAALAMPDPWGTDLHELDVSHLGWIRRGREREARGDYLRALAAYRQAEEAGPGRLGSSLGRARCLIELNRAEEAKLLLAKVLGQHPAEAAAYTLNARLELRFGTAESAELSLRKALDLEPGALQPTLELVRLLRNRGSVSEALERLEAARALNPGSTALLRALTDLELAAGDARRLASTLRASLPVAHDPVAVRALIEQAERRAAVQ